MSFFDFLEISQLRFLVPFFDLKERWALVLGVEAILGIHEEDSSGGLRLTQCD